MNLLDDLNQLLSEYYGETVAINICESQIRISCDRDLENLNVNKLTPEKDEIPFPLNTVLIGMEGANIFAERGFSIFQDTTYFNIDPDLIFLTA